VAALWADGSVYEPYIGRWSRLVAAKFLTWLDIAPDGRWLDVGCGTGAVTDAVLTHAAPTGVVGVDASEGFVAHAGAHVTDARARFEVASATALPFGAGEFDAAVSGLVLNFIPSPSEAVAEMARVTRPGGTVAAYIWDYAGDMQFLRHFWHAAGEVDPRARELDEGARFPICRPEPLRALFVRAGLADVTVVPVDVPTVFHDFDDLWNPFLGGQAPAPAYVMSLSEPDRDALRERLRARLPIAPDGTIGLIARAWAVRGTR
jgi:SAM-dependent methyltransferase